MTNSSSIPVTLVTGFLGSGKTTTILNYLNQKGSDERVAVLVNDFGRIGVDALTLRQAQSQSTVVHQVPGGCICCTAATGMTLALMNIIESESPDRIILEPTGIAKPIEIERLLRANDFRARAHLAQTIALVDLRRFADEAFNQLPIFKEQIDSADFIIANFSDRVLPEHLDSQTENLRSLLQPHQNFQMTVRGFLSPEDFRAEHRRPKSQVSFFSPSRSLRSANLNPLKEPAHAENYRETGQQWSRDLKFKFENLRATVQTLVAHPEILRVKGQFQTEQGYQHLEWVQNADHVQWNLLETPLEQSSFIEVVAKKWIKLLLSEWFSLSRTCYEIIVLPIIGRMTRTCG